MGGSQDNPKTTKTDQHDSDVLGSIPSNELTQEIRWDDDSREDQHTTSEEQQSKPVEKPKPQGPMVGDYIMLEKIGAGGGGQVFRAQHQHMERIVALKMLPKTTGDDRAVQRFYREVKSAAKLIHPNIVTAFDAGVHDGKPYLVMEYVDGRALSDIVAQEGPCTVDTACDFMIQAARGLAYAHSRGIVHRDIKPSNIMLDKDGAIKVLDMGLARSITNDDTEGDFVTAQGITQVGSIMGTVAFMSPEQINNAIGADSRTDIYSLGCTFYYLLAGKAVYTGDLTSVLMAHAQQPIPPLRAIREDVPEQLDFVYQQMMAKDVVDRLQSMNEVIANLEQFVAGDSDSVLDDVPIVDRSDAGQTRLGAMIQDTIQAGGSSATVVEHAPSIGIDLGTASSVIAHIDKETDEPATLLNAEGETATPSVVMMGESNLQIGTKALELIGTKATSVANHIKRELGQELYSQPVGGKEYPPEVLLALVLNKVVDDARRQLGDFKYVVIAVPAFFDDARRKAVHDAASIARLELLDTINEPTAVGVSYAHRNGFLFTKSDSKSARRIVVCDIGGGSFDASLLEIENRTVSVLSTDGAYILGGIDWDNRLVDEIARLFKEKYGIDPRSDPNAAGQLWRICEEQRRNLSDQNQAAIRFEFNGKPARINMSRRQFEDFTRDILTHIYNTIKKMVKRAKIDWSDVDHLLLVGGMSGMPLIRRMMQQMSDKEPETFDASQDAVAHGAALYASARLGKIKGGQPSFEIKEVNSHSMGVVATDVKSGQKYHKVLIPRNTRLPVSAKRTFKTDRAGQQSFSIYIVQGESKSLNECGLIGKCSIGNLPPDLPAGSPIIVEFRCSANGRLTVYLEVSDAGQRVTQEIARPSGLAAEDIDSWSDWLETMALCSGF